MTPVLAGGSECPRPCRSSRRPREMSSTELDEDKMDEHFTAGAERLYAKAKTSVNVGMTQTRRSPEKQ